MKKTIVFALFLVSMNAQIGAIPGGGGGGTGDVTGPGSAVADNGVCFNGTTGKTIKDCGYVPIPNSRQIICATGLTGCGAWTADRTIALDINALTEKVSPVAGTDFVPIYDVAGTATKKAKWPSSSGASSVSQLNDFQKSGEGTSTLTIGANCSGSAVCNAKVGWTIYPFTNGFGNITFTKASGSCTALIFVDKDGARKIRHNCDTLSSTEGTVSVSAGTSFPYESDPLWSCTGSAGGTWDASGCTDKRSLFGTGPILTSGNANCTVTATADGYQLTCSGGGANPGGSANNLQYQVNSTTFGGISGSTYDSTANSNRGRLGIAMAGEAGDEGVHFLRRTLTSADTAAAGLGRIRFGITASNTTQMAMYDATGTILETWDLSADGTNNILRFGSTSPHVIIGSNGYVRLIPTGTKPTCNSSFRGSFWVSNGTAGVADTVEVCSKDAADNYAWRTLI